MGRLLSPNACKLIDQNIPESPASIFALYSPILQKSPALVKDSLLILRSRGGAYIPYSILAFNMVELVDMEKARKITVEVPQKLLKKAQRASGTGITQTVCAGLQLVAASRTYARLRQFRGTVRFSRTLAELKADR